MCDDNPSPQNTISLLDLPVEILLHICSFLDAATLVHRLSLVCKDFNVILNDDSLWKTRISRIWPKSGFPILPPDANDELFWKLSCVAIERQALLWSTDRDKTMEKLSMSNIHYGTIDGLLLLNNAKACVSGARDRSLVYWVLPNEENQNHVPKVTSDAHGGWIWDLTALHDTVYSCSWDRTIKAWQLTDTGLINLNTYAMCVKFRRDVTGALLCLTSSAASGLCAAGSFCKSVLVFDPRSKNYLIDKFHPHQRAVVRIAINSNYIFSASEDKTVSIWDQRARKTLKTIRVGKEYFPMSIAAQDNIVYVGDNGGNLHVLDPKIESNPVRTYVTGHTKGITGVHCAPGCVITSSLDKTVRIMSPTNPPETFAILQSGYGEVARMDYMNEVLAISGTDGMEIWRPRNKEST